MVSESFREKEDGSLLEETRSERCRKRGERRSMSRSGERGEKRKKLEVEFRLDQEKKRKLPHIFSGKKNRADGGASPLISMEQKKKLECATKGRKGGRRKR